MEEKLSKKVNTEKVNKVIEFKKWVAEVKHVDDGL
jgi:hypothetical protein